MHYEGIWKCRAYGGMQKAAGILGKDSKLAGIGKREEERLFLNIMAVAIAANQVRSFIAEIIDNFYNWINKGRGYPNLTQTSATHAFDLVIIGGFVLFFVIRKILRNKHNRIQKKILTHKRRQENDENQ